MITVETHFCKITIASTVSRNSICIYKWRACISWNKNYTKKVISQNRYMCERRNSFWSFSRIHRGDQQLKLKEETICIIIPI